MSPFAGGGTGKHAHRARGGGGDSEAPVDWLAAARAGRYGRLAMAAVGGRAPTAVSCAGDLDISDGGSDAAVRSGQFQERDVGSVAGTDLLPVLSRLHVEPEATATPATIAGDATLNPQSDSSTSTVTVTDNDEQQELLRDGLRRRLHY